MGIEGLPYFGQVPLKASLIKKDGGEEGIKEGIKEAFKGTCPK